MSSEQEEKSTPRLPPIHADGVAYAALAETFEKDRDKWKRRALAFQEGYKDKAGEVTALEIQLMDLRAHGVDKVTPRQNESLRRRVLVACEERDEARASLLEKQEEIERLKARLGEIEEREAAVCPEDVPFDEYIRALSKHIGDLEHDFAAAQKHCDEYHAQNTR